MSAGYGYDGFQTVYEPKLPATGVGSLAWAQEVFDALADHGFDLTHPVEDVKRLIARRDEFQRRAANSAFSASELEAVCAALKSAGHPSPSSVSPAISVVRLMKERDEFQHRLTDMHQEFEKLAASQWANPKAQEFDTLSASLEQATQDRDKARAALEKAQRKIAVLHRRSEVLCRAYERLEIVLKEAEEDKDEARSELIHSDNILDQIDQMLTAAGYETGDGDDLVMRVAGVIEDAELATGSVAKVSVATASLAVGDVVTLEASNGSAWIPATIEHLSQWYVRVNVARDNAHDDMASGWYSQLTGASESANQKPWVIAKSDVQRMPYNQEAK